MQRTLSLRSPGSSSLPVSTEHAIGGAMVAALAFAGGAGLWAIAAGPPLSVPAAYGGAATLVPFAAGPAALCAAWSALALWRCGRRESAWNAALIAGTSLVAGLFAAGAGQNARTVILLSVVVPLLVAHATSVTMLGWATRLARRAHIALLALGAVPAILAFLPWPAPLLSIVALLPAMLATPALAAAFLSGARPDGRPRSTLFFAATFFGLPLALLAGTSLAAAIGEVGSFLAGALGEATLFFGAPVLLVLGVVAVLTFMLLGRTEQPAPLAPPSALVTAPAPAAQPAAVAAPATIPPVIVAAPVVTAPAASAEPVPARHEQALQVLADRFLDGDLTRAEYESQTAYILRSRRNTAAG